MHRIDGTGATADNKFTEGNPTTGVPATQVTADWTNAVQEELVNVIQSAGLALNKADNTQLAQAIDVKIAAAGGGGGSSTGEANTGSNVGTGGGQVFKQKLGIDLQLRTLKAGPGISIVTNALDVTIAATGTGGGEANTGANLGTGTGVYAGKSGIELQYKSLKPGAGITLSATATEITINSTGGGGGVTDHGALSGLADDDHPQYYNQARGDARYARLGAANDFGAFEQTALSFNTTSSRRYKTDIADMTPEQALELLSSLRIVSYRMKANGSRAAGVIAEELVGGPLDFCVARNANGKPEAVHYQPLFSIALAALQGLAARVAVLEAH